MKKVRVTADCGVTIVGPCTVKLTLPQWQARRDVLGVRWRRAGLFALPAGAELTFGAGEVLSLDPAEPAMEVGGLAPVGWTMPKVAAPPGKAVEKGTRPAASKASVEIAGHKAEEDMARPAASKPKRGAA